MTQPGPYLHLVLIYKNLASIRADAKETAAEQACLARANRNSKKLTGLETKRA